MQGTLSARQVDLDRLLATPEAPRRLPLAAVQAFGEMLGSALRPSWPVKLALNVDAMTLGGATVQNVGSDLRSDGTTWTLDRLEFRAPGFTQVKVDGRLYPLGKGLGFAGGASVDSNDPKNLVAWLAGRATTTAQFKPWHAKGDVTLRADRIAVERLRTEIDRGVVEGSVSYAWPAGDRPARLDGELRAADLDLDGVLGFGESALSGLGLERPGEVALAIEIGRAKIAGFDARNVAARLKLDAGGLAIERLSVGDLGDTSFVATGRIQTQSSPGGSITVNLDARDLDGIIALSEKFAPALAEPLRRLAARQKTATLQASVSMESSGADGANGKIGLTGKIGAIRVNVSASATGKREAFTLTDLGALAGADVRIDGQFEADESRPAARRCIGLDRIVGGRTAGRRGSTCRRAGRSAASFGSKASSPPARSMPAARARCALRPISRRRSISISSPARSAAARCRAAGRCASATRRGSMARSRRTSLDAPAVIAAAIGMPAERGAGGTGWSTEPIAWSATGLNGRIDFKAQRAVFAPWLVAQRLRGVARFNGAEVVFEDVAGELGKGRLEGRLAFRTAPTASRRGFASG